MIAKPIDFRALSAKRASALLGAAVFAFATLAATAGPARAEVMPDGITLVGRPDRGAPRVAISVLVRAGAADESPASAGWRRLLTSAMLRGATTSDGKQHSLKELQSIADTDGGALGVSVGDDTIEFSVTGQSSSAPQLLDLVLSVVLRPRLSDADLDTARKRQLEAVDAEGDDVALRALSALHSQLSKDARGELTAYGLPEGGTADSLTKLSDARLRELHALYCNAPHLVVGVAGDYDGTAIRKTLEADAPVSAHPIFSAIQPFFAPVTPGDPPRVVRQMRTPSAWVFISFWVCGTRDADLPALSVLAAALGQTPFSRLPERLLATNMSTGTPLADQAATQFDTRLWASEIVAFAQTAPNNVDALKNAMLDEVRKLRETPLTNDDLNRAKNYVRGSYAVEREPLHTRAYTAALQLATNAPADTSWPARVQAVTVADVHRVAQKYLGNYAVALIMPQQ